MTRVDPLVVSVLSDLARGLRALEIDFCIIGALVPELLLGVIPRRLTNDADATVALDSLADFEQLKERLAEFGFVPTRLPYRLTHRDGGWVDLLPYSKALAPTGHLDLTQDHLRAVSLVPVGSRRLKSRRTPPQALAGDEPRSGLNLDTRAAATISGAVAAFGMEREGSTSVETQARTPHMVFMLPQRLVVPLFQRPYVWNEENQWEPLWNDIVRVADRVDLDDADAEASA